MTAARQPGLAGDPVWGRTIDIALTVEGADARTTAVGTARGGIVSILLEGESEPCTGPASALPLIIARLVGLGPRRLVGDAVGIVDGIPDLDRASLKAAFPAEALQGLSLGDPDVLVWTVVCAWERDDGEVAGRAVAVADGAERGLTLIDLDAEATVARPATSTEVWKQLCGLLPYEPEITGVPRVAT